MLNLWRPRGGGQSDPQRLITLSLITKPQVVEYRKLNGGTESEGEVRAGTTFDIRVQIDLAAKGLIKSL